MRVFVAVVVATVVGALAWGAIAGSKMIPVRDHPHAAAADAAWRAALPTDPAAATDAFLARIPSATRARGDAFGRTRYLTIPLRLAALAGSVALLLFGGVAARMRDLARRVTSRPAVHDTLFASQMFFALYLLNLPVVTYAEFVRFRTAGFSQAPYSQWLADTTLGWGVETLFNVVGIVAILALVRRRPLSWPSWATGVYLAVGAAYLLLLPVYVEPLFNRLSPLADGAQKREIFSLARANGVPAEDVFVRDASRQSVLLDAHVSGFAGTAQIVLDDNTIAATTGPEVRMVMAHEIGHYVLAHAVKGLVFRSLVMGLGFLFIGWSAGRLISRFGASWRVAGIGDVGALPLIWGLFVLWGYLALPVTNGITRQQEQEADLFGLNASAEPLALAEYMIRDADTGQIDPTPLEEWVFYDHPSPRNRVYVAMRWRAEHLAAD